MIVNYLLAVEFRGFDEQSFEKHTFIPFELSVEPDVSHEEADRMASAKAWQLLAIERGRAGMKGHSRLYKEISL